MEDFTEYDECGIYPKKKPVSSNVEIFQGWNEPIKKENKYWKWLKSSDRLWDLVKMILGAAFIKVLEFIF